MFYLNGKKIAFFLSLFFASSYLSAGVIIDNELSFGTVVILDNSVASSVTVRLSDGKTFPTNKIRLLVPGQLGEYTLLDFPPYTNLNISVNFVTSKTSTNGELTEQFTLDSLTTEPTVTVNEYGMATVYIGGTLSTSGSGINNYINTAYKGRYNIVITY